ncbi:MAG: recombination-associated protein RdgC [Syntrophobacteraceae bacterium]
MGIKSSSATFARFYIQDPVTEDFWSYIDEKLQAGKFKECEDGQELSVGFSSWDDFLDTDFEFGSYHKGEYVAFNFRQDQRTVPAIITKQYVRQALQKYRDQHEGRWPSRKERQDIQEDMRSWLLSRALPKPAACEVVWSPGGKWMYLGTTSSKVMEVFLDYFEKHFRLYPVPLYHAHWALNLLPLDGQRKDMLNSMINVQSPNALDDGRFLGFEFLTWLWFFSEQFNGEIQVAQDKSAEVYLGERLVLTLPGEGKERVICTTQANSLDEARTALIQGKRVQEIQLFIKAGDNEYFLTLDSALWAVKGLKTPKQLPEYDEEDPDGRFLEKMYFIEEASSVLQALYSRFLSERLSPGWESDSLPLLNRWIATRGEGVGTVEQ